MGEGEGEGRGEVAGTGTGTFVGEAAGRQTWPTRLGTHCVLGLQSVGVLQPPQRPLMQRANGHGASLSVAQKKPNAGGMAGAVAGPGAGMPPGVGEGEGVAAAAG